MNRPIVLKTSFIILSIVVFLALFVPAQSVRAANFTLAAPDTQSFIKLEQEKSYAVDPFSDFIFRLEGWACDAPSTGKFADTTINTIRQINVLIQPLASAENHLVALGNALAQAGKENAFTKPQVEAAVSKAIMESVNRAGFSSESILLERAESLLKETSEKAKGGVKAVFGYSQNDKLFDHEFFSRPPWGAWKLSKIDQDEPSVVYIVENCYQKNDLEAMVNAIVSAATKLEAAATKFKEAKRAALAAAPLK